MTRCSPPARAFFVLVVVASVAANREGDLKSALRYLKQAARLGTESMEVENLSVTFLNLCAVLSQMGKYDARASAHRHNCYCWSHSLARRRLCPWAVRVAPPTRHKQALDHAQSAVFHCQEELFAAQNTPQFSTKAKAEKMVTMSIAYHNLAVELEYSGRLDMCLQWYKKAVSIANKYAKSNVALLKMFTKSYRAAKEEVRSDVVPTHLKRAIPCLFLTRVGVSMVCLFFPGVCLRRCPWRLCFVVVVVVVVA